MKIIDLLNKIANGEEVPKKIMYKDKIYKFDCDDGDYFNNENSEFLFADLFERCWTQDFINDTVEILEEEKKIPEKLDINLGNMTPTEKYISNTVNGIIDYLKSKGE